MTDETTNETAGGAVEGQAPAAMTEAEKLLAGKPAAADEAAKGDNPGAPFWDQWKLNGEPGEGGKPSDRDWLANKGWKAPEDIVKSYRELERAKGVPLPKGPDDADGWEALAKALGRPDTPDGYQIELGEGYDEGFVSAFKVQAHKLGLPPHVTQELAQWYEGSVNELAKLNAEAAEKDLRAAWKGQYDAGMDKARRAMAALEIDAATVNAMALGLQGGQRSGLSTVMQLLAKVGDAIGEDNGLAGGQGGGGAQGEEWAKARKAEILASPELRSKLHAGDPTLKADWAKINKIEGEAAEKRRAA